MLSVHAGNPRFSLKCQYKPGIVHMPLIWALRRERQKDQVISESPLLHGEFKANFGCVVPCLKETDKTKLWISWTRTGRSPVSFSSLSALKLRPFTQEFT